MNLSNLIFFQSKHTLVDTKQNLIGSKSPHNSGNNNNDVGRGSHNKTSLKGGKWKYMESVVTFPTPIFVTFYKVKHRFNKLNILEY